MDYILIPNSYLKSLRSICYSSFFFPKYWALLLPFFFQSKLQHVEKEEKLFHLDFEATQFRKSEVPFGPTVHDTLNRINLGNPKAKYDILKNELHKMCHYSSEIFSENVKKIYSWIMCWSRIAAGLSVCLYYDIKPCFEPNLFFDEHFKYLKV